MDINSAQATMQCCIFSKKTSNQASFSRMKAGLNQTSIVFHL